MRKSVPTRPRPTAARCLLRDAFNAGRSGEPWEAFEARCIARARWDRYLGRLLRCRPGVYPPDEPPQELTGDVR